MRWLRNGLMMDLLALNARERRSWRRMTLAVGLCFVVAGAILATSLLWPAASNAFISVPAMPR
jgi:hypothetical protein